MHRYKCPLSLGKAFSMPAPGSWLPFLPWGPPASSVSPRNLSHTSSNPQPTGINGSFKSFFPALPANTFNPQSLTTSHGDGVVNAELQTSSHLPKVTPRVLEIKTRSPDSHALVLNIPSVPSIIVAMEIILMPPIPHQDIAEMVQQKLYISPPAKKNTLPCSCSHGELQQGWGRGEQLSPLYPHMEPLFNITNTYLLFTYCQLHLP